jgi:SAM-dependent methyltransferase
VPEYDSSYYRHICGGRQTRFDRGRDGRVEDVVARHAPPLRSDSALLDIGCGYGNLLARFTDRYRLFGVELSDHAAATAHGRLKDALIIRADVQRGLPFGPRMDVVVAVNVIEHLDDPKAGVDAIAAALRPGGLCVIHLPTINNVASRLVYRLAYARDPTHVYCPTGREVRALFESAGFRHIEESYAPHRRWLLAHRRWHPAYLAAFTLVPERAAEPEPAASRRAPTRRRRSRQAGNERRAGYV